MNIDWVKKQRELQKRRNYEENQLRIEQNILTVEKKEEEFDWEQVKIPGLVVKGSAPQEMMTTYDFYLMCLAYLIKKGLAIS